MVYVISDVHGRLNRLEKMLKLINFQSEDTLYILGDVIDRGPDGIKIIRKIMASPNIKMLLGNHEWMMLNALDTLYDKKSWIEKESHLSDLWLWYNNEGDVTHRQLKHFRKDTRKEIFDFLRSLPLNIDIEVNGIKYKLVHAAPIDLHEYFRFRFEDETEYALWCRWPPYNMRELLKDKDYTLIFGHTPTQRFQNDNPLKIWFKDKMIGIDCGCSYPDGYRIKGRLGCLRLDDMQEFYIDDEIS